MFDDLMSDRVTIRTGDGKEYKDIPASVQKNRIYTDATEIPIRPGDEVIRRTPAGVDEVFIVEDPGLCSGVGGISDSYQMHVRRVDKAQHSLGSTPASATTAERARRDLVSSTINGLTITASFGVGTFPKHGSNVSELIKAADVAMYDAKNRGRDLVRVSGEPEPQADKSRTPERKLPPAGVLTEE